MTIVRLIADDLTGALDTAAEFAAVCHGISVYAAGTEPANATTSFAIDSGTREQSLQTAVTSVEHLASRLKRADIAYKKVDSLLRGHAMNELAACWRRGEWELCVVAPAFPFQGRITRNGVQLRRSHDGNWLPVADILELLTHAGLTASLSHAGSPIPDGVTVCDAESDEDLSHIVDRVRSRPGPVLWCGSAGLAQALVGNTKSSHARLKSPVLGLFGSDQDVTQRQLAACGDRWLQLTDTSTAETSRLRQALDRYGVAMASFVMPPCTTRKDAATHILKAIEVIIGTVPKPSTLLAAGGETLRAICTATGASHLDVLGQFEPGLPFSSIRGGLWDGVTVVSKSGAFGVDRLWCDLLSAHGS